MLVTSQYGYSANLERIMKAQAFADPSKAQFMISKKTLEINPRHPIIASLKAKAEADGEAINADTRDLATLLYDAALLNSGFAIDDAKDFSSRLFRLMKSGLAIESLELLPEMELPAEPEAEKAADEEGEDDGEEEDGDEGEEEEGDSKEEL